MRVEIQNTVTGSATIGMYIQRTVIADHLYTDYGVVGISKTRCGQEWKKLMKKNKDTILVKNTKNNKTCSDFFYEFLTCIFHPVTLIFPL